MSEPFLGEIRMFGGNFAPSGWALCNGQLLSISTNTALFSILVTTFGGNGTSTFALPNLQGMSPLGSGTGTGLTPRVLGATGGEQTVAVNSMQMPAHSHGANCNAGMGDQYGPVGNFWATDAGGNDEYASTGGSQMAAGAIGTSGESQGHPNLQPYLVVNFIIALTGIYPSRN